MNLKVFLRYYDSLLKFSKSQDWRNKFLFQRVMGRFG